MCGILGAYNFSDEYTLRKSLELLTHRGPDDSGVEWFDNLNSGLGHQRLSIIDLSPAGHQPMATDDGRYWITYNGEIYNYKEIREKLFSKGYKFKSNCDTEVLLNAYQEWGKGCLEKFNGMFAFAILDTKKNKLFAARDRLGVKPFYYAQKNSSLVFASEIKAILAMGIVEKEPDFYALHTPTRYQIAPYTGFKNIYKLPAGHYLEFKCCPQNTLNNTKENDPQIAQINTDFKTNNQRNTQNDLKENGTLISQIGKDLKTNNPRNTLNNTKEIYPQITQINTDLKTNNPRNTQNNTKERDLKIAQIVKNIKEEESSPLIAQIGTEYNDGGELIVKEWWRIEPVENENLKVEEVREKLDWLLNDAVRLQMISDVPVGVLLSGGLDSSIISALMRKNSNEDIYSFTIKFREEDNKFEKAVDDSKYAKIVAKKFGLLNKEITIEPDVVNLIEKIVYYLDEPLSDPAAINTYLISKTARDVGIPVLLNGMGGDEVFGGYRKHLACLKADLYQKIFPGFLRNITERIFKIVPLASKKYGFRNLRWLKRFLSFASLQRYDRFLVSDLSLSEKQFNEIFHIQFNYIDTYYYLLQLKYYENHSLSYLTQMCFNDSSVFLPAHNLLYSDKASMAASIESRPPLTDHRIVEYMFTLPPEFRIRRNNQKWLLKEVSKKYLPAEIVNRPKAPFGSPLRAWIKGQLREMVDDYLSEESVKRRGFYNYKTVSELIKNNRIGKEDNAHIIWTMLNNEIWFRTFFE